MNKLGHEILNKLYRHDIWDGFIPVETEHTVQGWNGAHPSLKKLPDSFEKQIIVDVGVWKGQSTITLANNLRRQGIAGVVIAVDTFLGSPEHWTSERSLFKRSNGPDLYKTFLSNVARHELTDYVIPLPQTSTTACKILHSYGIRPTLVHVDAAHEYREALADIEDYWSILSPGGVMIGDDYHDSWPGVIRAAGEFSARIGRPLHIESPKFLLRKQS
jgi:hypothetical protein